MPAEMLDMLLEAAGWETVLCLTGREKGAPNWRRSMVKAVTHTNVKQVNSKLVNRLSYIHNTIQNIFLCVIQATAVQLSSEAVNLLHVPRMFGYIFNFSWFPAVWLAKKNLVDSCNEFHSPIVKLDCFLGGMK